MSAALLDSSIYIDALRQGDDGVLTMRRLGSDSFLWLSAVVLEELYAGVADSDRYGIERLERDFERIDRILVPNQKNWAQAGKLLERVGAKHGFEEIGRARLTNDALIAVSAARTGVTVVTSNTRDFTRLAEFQALRWKSV
jgi:predicted nucleic acid-binding protein